MKKLLFSCIKFKSIFFAWAAVSSLGLMAQSESINGLVINNTSKKVNKLTNKRALNATIKVNLADSLLAFQSGSVANGNAGVAFFNGEFWVSKWASDSLFTLNMQGQVTSKFTVPGVTGVRSITTDGTSLYMGGAAAAIYQVNPATKTLTSTITISGGGATVGARMCAYDPTANSGAGGFWIGNFTSDIVLVSMTGATLTTIPMATHQVDAIYGGAVDTVSPGGPYLMVYNQGGLVDRARVDIISIPSGMPTGIFYGTTTDFIDMQAVGAAPIAGGLFITDQFSAGSTHIFGIMQGTPDVLFGYNLEGQTCLNPTGLTATNATNNTVDLDWVSSGATIWNIEYGPVGYATGSGTKVSNITTKPYTLTGLNSSTSYEFRVEDSCAVGSTSFWSEKGSFATTCPTILGAYSHDFETGGVFDPCLTNSSTSGEVWVLSQDYSPTTGGGHGPATDNSGIGFFAYVDDSESPSSSDVTLTLPEVNVSFLTNPELEFYHYSDREAGARNATLYVEVDAGIIKATVFTDSTNTNGWKKNTVDLTPYANLGNIKISFIVDETNGTFYDDIAIDDISIQNGTAVGIEKNVISNDLSVSPNPSNGIFNVKLNTSKNSKISLKVLDINGREVYNNMYTSSSNFNTQLDLSKLEKGLYFLQMNADNKQYLQKVIIK